VNCIFTVKLSAVGQIRRGTNVYLCYLLQQWTVLCSDWWWVDFFVIGFVHFLL